MNARWWAVTFPTVGLLLAGTAIYHLAAQIGSVTWLHLVVDVVVLTSAAVAFVYAGYYYDAQGIPIDRYRTVWGWIVGAGLLSSGFGVIVLYVGTDVLTTAAVVEVLQLTASAGLLAGLLTGTLHVSALTNAKAAARAEASANALADEQARLKHLDEILRHYVMNAINVVTGYTALLREAEVDDREAALDAIDSRARTIATLIDHVRVIQAVDVDPTPTPLDDVLADVVDAIDAEAHLVVEPPERPSTVAVSRTHLEEAMTLLCDVMVELLERGGASEKGGHITVTSTRHGATVRLAVTVTPASLPAAIEGPVTDPVGSDVGLRVYLAHRLLEEFGQLALRAADDEAVRCELELPVVSTPT